jgi:hypothetical protein
MTREQLYATSEGKVKCDANQFAHDADNNDPARRTWIFDESTRLDYGTISLSDGRQLYAKSDGTLAVAHEGNDDNNELDRRLWSVPGLPASMHPTESVKRAKLEETGADFHFIVGVFGGAELNVKLELSDTLAAIRKKIQTKLELDGLGAYSRNRHIFQTENGVREIKPADMELTLAEIKPKMSSRRHRIILRI